MKIEFSIFIAAVTNLQYTFLIIINYYEAFSLQVL